MSAMFAHGRLRLYLLKLLDESPRHGYDLIKALGERFQGHYAPSAGTVYPRLARLEAEGLVTSSEEDGRKTYRITDAGRAELNARERELDDLEEEITGSVRDLGRQIKEEVHGSIRGLRAQLKSAAREIREEVRARKADSHETVGEIEQLARWFRHEVRDVARRSAPSRDDLERIRRVLHAAALEVRSILRS